MTAYEQQVLNTGKQYDQAILAAETESLEVNNSFVPMDHVHEIINNPVDEGFDEG